MSRILSISYDEALLHTREMLLRREGFAVESALGFSEAVQACEKSEFDLVIMGHSIPPAEREQLIRQLRAVCSTPILALRRANEPLLRTADYNLDSGDPAHFRSYILGILGHHGGSHPDEG